MTKPTIAKTPRNTLYENLGTVVDHHIVIHTHRGANVSFIRQSAFLFFIYIFTETYNMSLYLHIKNYSQMGYAVLRCDLLHVVLLVGLVGLKTLTNQQRSLQETSRTQHIAAASAAHHILTYFHMGAGRRVGFKLVKQTPDPYRSAPLPYTDWLILL